MQKELSEHGRRTKAGRLLSAFIRQIAEEQTEMVKDPETGEDRMASKAEALARLIWKKALGYTEQRTRKYPMRPSTVAFGDTVPLFPSIR